MKKIQIAALLLGTLGMLVLFASVPPRPAFGHAQERQTNALSYYLMDTEFLRQCAERHPSALEKSGLVSAEVQWAVLHLPPSDEPEPEPNSCPWMR